MKNKLVIFLLTALLVVSTAFPLPASEPGQITTQQGELRYTIKSGDTFYQLARRLNTTPTALQELNPDSEPRQLEIGSELKIKTEQPKYRVQPGDTLWKISNQVNLNHLALREANLIADPNSLYPNEIILTPENLTTRLYFLKFTPTEAHLVAETIKINTDSNPYLQALRKLINGPTKREGYQPLPSDTEIKGINLEEGIAQVNFSSEIREANVGSSGEYLLLQALANTLTEFEEIKGLEILVEGQKIESLGGHIVLDKPLERNLTVVGN